MSYCKLTYHIVFRTYNSEPTIPEDSKKLLFSYIHKICISSGWTLIRINGYKDHIHILLGIRQTDSIPSVVKHIKGATSHVFRGDPKFQGFKGWNNGYGVFSVGYREIENIKQYIINQEQHHSTTSTNDELSQLLIENGLEK